MGNVLHAASTKVAGILLKVYQKMFMGPKKPKPPAGITEINDSVWELYRPADGNYEMDIVFFHGLQMGDFENAFWRTWLSEPEKPGDEQLVWPQKWLSISFPKARIFSISYNSSATRPEIQLEMYRLGENLVQDLIKDPLCSVGTRKGCPVFLVGHSLGGIVIKQFILSAINKRGTDDIDSTGDIDGRGKIQSFLDNFKGVFYYATPHGGSKIADFVKVIPNTNPVLNLLTTLNTERGRINEEFRQHRYIRNVRACAIAEGQRTTKLGFSEVVVPEGSARQDIEEYFTFAKANHLTVCKARRKDDPTVIRKLEQFITNAIPEYVLQPRQDELVLDPDNIQ